MPVMDKPPLWMQPAGQAGGIPLFDGTKWATPVFNSDGTMGWQDAGTIGPSYPAMNDRALITAVTEPGVHGSGDLHVTQRAAGTNLSVDVSPGICCVAGTNAANQGNYLCQSTAVVNVPLAGSPPAGQSRIDLIVAQVRDGAVIGGSTRDWMITNVTGTPAATGQQVAPAVPASALVLGQVAVGPTAVTITNANITDRRIWSNHHAVGTALDARSGTVWANNGAGGWMTVTGSDGPYLRCGNGFRGNGIAVAIYAGSFHPVPNIQQQMDVNIGISLDGGWGTGDVVRGVTTHQYAANMLTLNSITNTWTRAGNITGDVLVNVAYGLNSGTVWTEGTLTVLVLPRP